MANQPGEHPPNFRKGQNLPTADEMQRLSRGTVQQIVGGRGIKVLSFNSKIVIEAVEVLVARGVEARHFEIVTVEDDYLECNWVDGEGTDLNPAAYYYLAKPMSAREGGGSYAEGDFVIGARNIGSTGVVNGEGDPCHWEVISPTGGGGGVEEWTEISAAAYTATPASISRITMSDTSMLKVGLPLRYVIGATTYYGLVNAISADSYIDVMGAPLSGDLVELYYGWSSKVIQVELFIARASFGTVANDLLDSIMKTAFRWRLGNAFLVGFSGKLKTADTVTNPKINMKVGGDSVSTNDSGKGIQPTGSWVNNPLTAVDVATYVVAPLDAITVACTVIAGVLNAADLSVSCIFVME